MRKFWLMLSAFMVLICLVFSGFFYWRLCSPGNSFPLKVQSLHRVSGPEYRKDEFYPGVYLGIYATGLINQPGKKGAQIFTPDAVLHTVYPMASAEEAKDLVRKNRETWKKQTERYDRINENGGSSSSQDSAIFIATDDQPENDYLVYVSNGRANVEWASGKWFCTVTADAERMPSRSEPYSAAPAFDFARALPYPPNATSPPRDDSSRSLYELVTRDVPIWFRYWYPMIIPLVIAFPLLLLTLLRRKKNALPEAVGV
jgi:hypothetical protein